MAIDVLKVSPPKTFDEVNSTYNIIENSFEIVELRGGIGNKTIISFSDVRYNQEVSNMYGYISGSIEDKLEIRRPLIKIDKGDLLYDSYIKNRLEDSKEREKVNEDNMWFKFKLFIRKNIILLIMNHVSNEMIYKRLTDSLFDSLILEDGDLDNI